MNKTARHSSIQFWKAQGLEISHTGSIAGHTKESTMKIYYEFTEKDINEKVAKFDFPKIDI